MPSRLLLAAILAAAPARRIAAQQADSLLPRTLVAAFVRGYALSDSGESPDITVAAIPGGVQPDIALAPQSTVLGTIALRRGSYVLATSTMAPDSLLRWTAHAYNAQGWTANATLRLMTTNPAAGGFLPAPPAIPTTFCKDGREVDVNASHSPDGFTSVRYRASASSPLCTRVASAARPPSPRPASPAVPLPLLHEPPNSSVAPQCFAAFGSSQRTQSTVSTTMDPAALLAYYGDQMVKQGWTPIDAAPAITRGVWTRPDSSGVTHLAAIVIGVSPTASSCRDQSIEVTTLRR